MSYSVKIKIGFIAISLFTLIGSQTIAATPNILFIIGDDMGVDAIKGFDIGMRHAQTPNLDQLRSFGVTFTNVWATPVCAPTRASLITGKYGLNNGVNTIPGWLSTEHKSIFKEIDEQSNGQYNNCLIGKWHLARQSDYNHPFEHGVNDFMGLINAGVEDYYKWYKYEDGKTDTCYSYTTQYFTDYAIDWIKQQDKPWFMWLAHVSPHAPFHIPPQGTFSIKNTDNNKRKYKAMIESLDYEIGRLLDSIPDHILENTIIIFLGDNGSPGSFLSGFPDNRGKQTIYQGGINVPLIISGKGVSRVNEVENALINVSDFYVTLSQIVNPDAFPSNKYFDSYSFKHLLNGTAGSNRTYNYMELGANSNVPNNQYTARNEQFKLLDMGNGTLEFYDLKTDTFEIYNLLKGTLSLQEAEAKENLFNLMVDIRGEVPYIKPPTVSPRGRAGKYPIVHTGVSSFYGTDAEIIAPEQTDNLYWQDAGRVQNFPSYTDNGDNTITDNVTGLIWQKDMGEKISYFEAVEKANGLTLGGYDDWRIPSIKELYSIILFNGRVMGATAVTPFIDTNYFIQPFGDVDAGERSIDAQVWSSTQYTGLTMNADTTIFGVNFIDGRIKGYPKYKTKTGEANIMYFRMVRGNIDYGNNLFANNGDGTVTDSATLRMWQKADDGTVRDWLSSIQYCEDLELAGYDDWHLPNAKELQSLVDYRRSPSATNSAAIDTVFRVSEITDPDGNAGHYPYYWATTTHLDGPNPFSAAVYVAFGKALGKMNENLMDVHGAGAQRSDPKTGLASDYPKYHGPQGDVQMVYNHCRCVRVLKNQSINIGDTRLSKVTFFPNPARDRIIINWSGSEQTPVKVNIYTITGELVFSNLYTHYDNEINVSNLSSGMYLIVLLSELSKPIKQKFIKL
jgi:arylsulfatase A-like enzyme